MPARGRQVLSFVKMLWMLSFSTVPLGLLTISSLAISYFSKKLISQTTSYLERLYHELESGQDVSSLRPFVLSSCLSCCSITLLYWLRPAHDSVVAKLVECSMMERWLGMSFEDICRIGPARSTSRIYRSALSIRSAVSILVFDLLGSLIAILSSLRILYEILEGTTFAWFLVAFCVISVLQTVLFMTLDHLKKRCVKVRDTQAEEMNGFYENFVLAKITNTDEHGRMSPLFKSNVFLKYQVLLCSIKFQSELYFVVLNVLVLCQSTQVRMSVFRYLKEMVLLVSALNNLVAKGFELESKRIEVESMMEAVVSSAEGRTLGPGRSAACPVIIESLDLSGICVFLYGASILQNVSLSISRNDKIALIGSNGSGKSTFFRFLLGFHQYSGCVCINREAADLSSGMLRGHVSYLSQNGFIEGSVLDVLRVVIPDDEIEAVCKRFGAHGFISRLPQGYQTSMDELSQGQCRMVNVIRSYFKKASILLADEPADCLDPSDRENVMDILLGSDRHQIKIVILHSREYIHKFDRVLVAGDHTIKSYTLNAYVERVNSRINASS